MQGLAKPKLTQGFPCVIGKPEKAAECQFSQVAFRKEIQWLIQRGAPRARAPPYGENRKYHISKAEIKSFPTVPNT